MRETQETAQLRTRIGLLADDIGRLQRHAELLTHFAEQLANHAQVLHTFVTPSAAELAASYAPGDDQAIQAALEAVDAAHTAFCSRLKVKTT